MSGEVAWPVLGYHHWKAKNKSAYSRKSRIALGFCVGKKRVLEVNEEDAEEQENYWKESKVIVLAESPRDRMGTVV